MYLVNNNKYILVGAFISLKCNVDIRDLSRTIRELSMALKRESAEVTTQLIVDIYKMAVNK